MKEVNDAIQRLYYNRSEECYDDLHGNAMHYGAERDCEYLKEVFRVYEKNMEHRQDVINNQSKKITKLNNYVNEQLELYKCGRTELSHREKVDVVALCQYDLGIGILSQIKELIEKE